MLLKAWIKLDADILRLEKQDFLAYLPAYADLWWIMVRDGLASVEGFRLSVFALSQYNHLKNKIYCAFFCGLFMLVQELETLKH